MDSKIVSREIKRVIWPELKAAGFSIFTARVAWRHLSDRIDVLEFRSFNKYNADVIGTTTFSFVVGLGSYLLYVPPQWPPKVKDGTLLPIVPECYFRGSFESSMPSKLEDKTIWHVDTDGKNLPWCIQGVLKQIAHALPWYSNFDSREGTLQLLLQEPEHMPTLWGFGRNPSPLRSYLSGYVALSIGQHELAAAKLAEAVKSKCFVSLFSSVAGAITRAT